MKNKLKEETSNGLKKILSLVLFSFLLVTPIFAQELTSVESTGDSSNYELKGIKVDQITEAPSALGLWWRGVKENVSLALTFDPVKKAEKNLKYAEERMQIAEKFSDLGENVKNQIKNQEKIQQNIEKAQKFMKKVELKKEKWLGDKNQEKVNNLINNIASHQVRKEVIFDKLEEKLSSNEDNQQNGKIDKNKELELEKIIDLRDKGLKNSQRLINAINNKNISENVKEHLQGVKEKIKAHSMEIDNYKKVKEQLKSKAKEGVKDISEDLKSLIKERKEQIRVHLEDAKKIMPSLGNTINNNIKPDSINRRELEKNIIQNRKDESKEDGSNIRNREINQEPVLIQKKCQNFPPPSFCPGGTKDIIVIGSDENGCKIYACNSNQIDDSAKIIQQDR